MRWPGPHRLTGQGITINEVCSGITGTTMVCVMPPHRADETRWAYPVIPARQIDEGRCFHCALTGYKHAPVRTTTMQAAVASLPYNFKPVRGPRAKRRGPS